MDLPRITVRLDPDVMEVLREEAQNQGLELASLCRAVLTQHARGGTFGKNDCVGLIAAAISAHEDRKHSQNNKND